jgi:CheY-like chemotaxis protein
LLRQNRSSADERDNGDPKMTTGPRVLVVDDERFFREAIRELLEADGLTVVAAANAAEALEAATDPDLGVVVLDIQLPDQSGLEVLRTLRDRRPELRMVMLSAHTDQEYVLEALRLGACDYLAKPLHEEELRLSVRRALEAFDLAQRFGALRGRFGALAGEVERLVRAPAEDRGVLAAQLAEAASRLLDAGKTSVLLREPIGDRLRVAATVGRKASDAFDAVSIGDGVAGRAVAQGTAIVVDDVSTDPRFSASDPDRYESGSFVVMPLGRGSDAFGALCATDRRDGAGFAEEDVALLRLLALASAPALDPTEPLLEHDVMPEALAELTGGAPELPARTAVDAELARAVCDAMTAEIEPERMLRAALGAVATQLDASPVSVYLLDAGSGELRREAQASREGDGPGDRERLAREQGLPALAFADGVAIESAGPDLDPRCDPTNDTAEDGVSRPHWVLPLRFRNRTLGVCRIFPRAGTGALDEDSADLLAAALSAALRNVLLYRSLVESIEEVAQVRRETQQRSG